MDIWSQEVDKSRGQGASPIVFAFPSACSLQGMIIHKESVLNDSYSKEANLGAGVLGAVEGERLASRTDTPQRHLTSTAGSAFLSAVT